MNGKERMRIALSGGTPDRVPVGFFYNCDYKAKCAGITSQDYIFGTNEDRFNAMASTFQLHREDWIHSDSGINHDWEKKHKIVWDENKAFVENLSTGQRDDIRLDLTLTSAQERSNGPGLDYGYSYIKLNRPLDSIKESVDLRDAQIRSANELIEQGFLDPPRRLVQLYGRDTFITLPMSNLFFNSLVFFGLEEGLIATLTKPKLFTSLLEMNARQEFEVVRAASMVGLDGIWLAEMLISADIIPPKIYVDTIAPLHRQIVTEAHRLGLKAIAYLTGNCLPLLSTARAVSYDGVVVESQDKSGNRINVEDVRKSLGPDICVFGNLDPIDLLIYGSDEALRQEVRRQVMVAGKNGSFVTSSNIISLPVKPEQINRIIELNLEYGQYPLKG
ncbi:MAG: uroporphyrinogen decarboxylase family protein [Anaerolineales bacterium]|jgi:hypothetical protein